jgi:hypothetical protein
VTEGITLRGSELVTRGTKKLRQAGRCDPDVDPTVPAARPARGFCPVPRHVRYVALIAATVTAVGCLTPGPASATTQTAVAPVTPAAAAQTLMAATQAATVSAAGRKALALGPEDTSETAICLSNDNNACITADDAELIVSVVSVVIAGISLWIQIKRGLYKAKHRNGSFQQLELEDNQNGLCMADTGGYAYLTTCGADGTYWFVVPHNDGAYLESRYEDGLGVSDDLTADPVANGARLFVSGPAQSGSPYWQTWTGYPSLP